MKADWRRLILSDDQLILFGANDAVLPLPTTSQHVPIEKYKQFLQEIVSHENIVAHKPKILLATPPPLDEIRTTELDLAKGHASSQRLAKVSAAYSEVAREVAKANDGVVLIDLWKGIMDKAISMTPGFDASGPALGTPESGQRGGLELLLPDGLHMSGEAYKVLYDLVLPHIGTEWKNLPEGDRTGYVFPDWQGMPAFSSP